MKKLFFIFAAVFLTGCSLKYSTAPRDAENVPELAFSNVKLSRYEDKKQKIFIQAEKIEQYKNENSIYAKNIEFILIDEEGNKENEGFCKLLAADEKEKKYTLYDDIQIKNYKDNIELRAKSLKWNGNSEQLTSGRNENVTLKKDDTIIYGSGFSASAVSKTYSFAGAVSGEILTSSENQDSDNQTKMDSIQDKPE